MFGQYLEVIRTALVVFPLLAVVITLPYLVYNYRKRGSVMSLRVPIVYSFILYLLACYFLVILPLPPYDTVAQMAGPTTQLAPFSFIGDIFRESAFVLGEPATWLSLLNNKAFYQVVFNLLMTVPFGIYLKYYFRCSLVKTLGFSFALSLFFELTQLSGLYFIYPRGYRLFDVDDLIINTMGGAVGYLLAIPLTKILPTREEIDQASHRRSQKVSLLRRLVSLFCDSIALMVFTGVVSGVLALLGVHVSDLGAIGSSVLMSIGYFGILPSFMNSQTICQKLTRMKTVRIKDEMPAKWYQHLARIVSIMVVFIILPQIVVMGVAWMVNHQMMTGEGWFVLMLAAVSAYAILVLIMTLRTAMRKPLFYERLSATKLISTTAIKE
ncbi:MAG: VanZ family protein [Candidatus Saccharibacteria bacterium]|nr:VanZ family protein [Candidatus Saccharibacteria bacterium]